MSQRGGGTTGAQPGGELRGRRVLIVEDEFLIALDIEDALAELGCEVLGPVPTVAEAMRLAEPGRCDLAVLDVRLAASGDDVLEHFGGNLAQLCIAQRLLVAVGKHLCA